MRSLRGREVLKREWVREGRKGLEGKVGIVKRSFLKLQDGVDSHQGEHAIEFVGYGEACPTKSLVEPKLDAMGMENVPRPRSSRLPAFCRARFV